MVEFELTADVLASPPALPLRIPFHRITGIFSRGQEREVAWREGKPEVLAVPLSSQAGSVCSVQPPPRSPPVQIPLLKGFFAVCSVLRGFPSECVVAVMAL